MEKPLDIDITPDKSLIQKLGLIGYRTEQAIAELVDNSIDARIEGTLAKIQVQLGFQDRWVGVRDDGIGMDRQDLTNAMTIAKGTKTDEKLGKFGIGMKSACSALGKKFKITTSKLGSKIEYSLQYDEDQWLANENLSWKNFRIMERELPEKEVWHGTRIVISELKVPLYPMQVTKFKESFGIRYAPYLHSGQITIQVNSTLCKPQEPDLVPGSKKVLVVNLRSGAKINGYVALLRKRSIRGNYGIHLFKNKRLIKAFEKFGFPHHPENARVIGKLDLDHVPVNFHKSAFLEESPEYQEAEYEFSHNQVVLDALKEGRLGNEKQVSVDAIFRYIGGEPLPENLLTRVRSSVAKDIISSATDFNIDIDGAPVEVTFVDEGDSLYSISSSKGKHSIIINRNNDLFVRVKNPLFLIGLIAVEARLIMRNPHYSEFMKDRNVAWASFLKDWKANEGRGEEREREQELPPLQGYGLSTELIELHDRLKENYDGKFQFTSLATLLIYLNNALGTIVYTVHTTPGKGLYLSSSVEQYSPKDTLVMVDPKSQELEVAISASKARRVIVIREYAEIVGGSYAAPEKAWVDLVNDVLTHKIPVDSSELTHVLRELVQLNLVTLTKLEQLLKHSKKGEQVRDILERVF